MQIKLQIWDTAGDERFRAITSSYYRGAQGIIIVYSVADRGSFNHVTHWNDEIEKYAAEGVNRLLVGNKCDLERVVSNEEGQGLADTLGMKFLETSATDAISLDLAFRTVCPETQCTVVLQVRVTDTDGGALTLV